MLVPSQNPAAEIVIGREALSVKVVESQPSPICLGIFVSDHQRSTDAIVASRMERKNEELRSVGSQTTFDH